MVEEILRVAELIQAAALAPETWQAALASAGELLGGEQVTLVGLGGGDMFAAASGLDEADLNALCAPDAMRLAGPVMALMPSGVAVAQQSLMSDEVWSRSAYYNECIRPLGAFHGIGFRRESPGGSLALFSVCRPRRAGAYEATSIAAVQSLMPHICTALEVQRRLRAAERRHAGLSQLLDRVDAAVIAADAAARPLHVNARAARLAAERDGFTIGDTLMGATPAATRELACAIAAAAACGAGERVRLSRPSGRPPLLATLLPIGGALPGLGSPQVVVFIAEPDAPPALDRAALADTYRLTCRETEIAALLAGGLALETIAARLGIGIGTARNHLKRVFDKTGTSSQAALVASLRGLTQWLR